MVLIHCQIFVFIVHYFWDCSKNQYQLHYLDDTLFLFLVAFSKIFRRHNKIWSSFLVLLKHRSTEEQLQYLHGADSGFYYMSV